MNAVGANSISTFGGNPVAVAAANANLDYLLAHDLQGNARRVGARMRARLEATATRHPWIAEVRGRGLMIAIETVRPGGIQPDAPAATAVLEAARRHGVLIGKGGLYGNVLRIAPPLSITEVEADHAIDAIDAAIAEVAAMG